MDEKKCGREEMRMRREKEWEMGEDIVDGNERECFPSL